MPKDTMNCVLRADTSLLRVSILEFILSILESIEVRRCVMLFKTLVSAICCAPCNRNSALLIRKSTRVTCSPCPPAMLVALLLSGSSFDITRKAVGDFHATVDDFHATVGDDFRPTSRSVGINNFRATLLSRRMENH